MRRRPFAFAAAAVLLFAAGPAFAQAGSSLPDPPVPCSSFARGAGGVWTVTAPAMLDFNGVPATFPVGTRLMPGWKQDGVEIPALLDRECGNRRITEVRP